MTILKNFIKRLSITALVFLLCAPVPLWAMLSDQQVYSLSSFKEDSPLLKIPSATATVGVVPYYCDGEHKVWVFLGREGPKKAESAGKFSDFGGSTEPDGSTLVKNMVREVTEETMGQVILKESDILQKGLLLYKENEKNGRKIYYVFCPFSEAEYQKTKNFNELRQNPEYTATLSPTYLEKDQFAWVNLEDLRSMALVKGEESFPLKDIAGKTHEITVRKFFRQDCLSHPRFPDLQEQLKKSCP